MKKYKILTLSIFFIFVLVYITACMLNNLPEDVVGYRIIKNSIPEVTLKDTDTKMGSNGISYKELGYKKSDLPYDEVRDFYSDVSVVRKGKKYGLVNSDLEEVVPLEYDMIIRASYFGSKSGAIGNVDKIYYAQKGNKWVTIDLNTWEICKFVAVGKSSNISSNQPSNMTSDADIFLLENCSAIVVEGELVSFEYNGEELLIDNKEGFKLLPMYRTEFLSDINMLVIRKGNEHAAFNPLDIDGSVAMWRHIGDQGTVFFPYSWLDETPCSFYDVKVYTSGLCFEYAFRKIANLLNADWKKREKDQIAEKYLEAKIIEKGIDVKSLLKSIWSYNPYWTKKGYSPFEKPTLVCPMINE
ncbi:MAG: WG repeat-containing protein [Firmicutes bacterium]|nr:WG repeat-containing protein [Bacillota bacterium]